MKRNSTLPEDKLQNLENSSSLAVFRPSVDWSGLMTEQQATMWITRTKQQLCLHVRWDVQVPESPLASSGKFHEGLWEATVAELFLGLSDGTYFEFNLAPNAAWWACALSSPRERSPSQPDMDSISTTADGSTSGLFIPWNFFPHGTQLHSWNMTFIAGVKSQTFYSAAELPGEEPDFHQPRFFHPWPGGAQST